MTKNLPSLPLRYQAALRAYLKPGRSRSLQAARGIASSVLSGGMQTLELARLHEEILTSVLLPPCPPHKRAALIQRATTFFVVAVTPLEKARRSAMEVTAHLKGFIEALSRRTVELASLNLELTAEIIRRKASEESLRKSERHYADLLDKSERLQQELRRMSRKILAAQEDERRRISRELHDVIAQTLTGINLRLAALKKSSATNTRGLDRTIEQTQRLVAHSVSIVHQFARDLRPAVLDDLGLIPALHSFMKQFTEQTGVRCQLTAIAELAALDTVQRTVLFRVAQEALTNVARHAKASKVTVHLVRVETGIRMMIADDGKSFEVGQILKTRRGKRLGLLGMRERLEMIGGRFDVESSAGNGTTVTAWIPVGRPSTKTIPGGPRVVHP